MKTLRPLVLGMVLLMSASIDDAVGQPQGFNYEEDKVPSYTLPDPLLTSDGQRVTSAEAWTSQRRGEVLALFEQHVYGKSPSRPAKAHYSLRSRDENALDGKAIRQEITIQLGDAPNGPKLELLLYLPKEAKKPVPAFIGLNFNGNHTVQPNPAIAINKNWIRDASTDHRATESSRGQSSSRWPVGDIIQRGYAVGTVYCGDIDPDFDDGFQNGVHPLFYDEGQTRPADDEWGTIGAWAWGLSRILDYLETVDEIDAQHVAVMGHSRLGKTSLWAGAQDERFALVISNNSGCGGAALSRRRFGETVRRINTSFPHWFCDNFQKYNDREDQLPVDQHMLVALIAPRPVLVCSAEEDKWADPVGEFLSAKGADSVYRLLGTDGLAAEEMPGLNQPMTSTIGYRIRPGKHDVTSSDWQAYMDFADHHFGR